MKSLDVRWWEQHNLSIAPTWFVTSAFCDFFFFFAKETVVEGAAVKRDDSAVLP